MTTINNWNEAIKKLNRMPFPFEDFKARVSNPDRFTVTTNSFTHYFGKGRHGGRITHVSDLFQINGFYVDCIEKYCFECRTVYETVMIIFNNQTNQAFQKVVVSNLPQVNQVFEDQLDFNAVQTWQNTAAIA